MVVYVSWPFSSCASAGRLWHPPAALNKKVSLSAMPPIFPTLRSKRDVCNHKYEHHALHNKKKERSNGVTPIEMEGVLFSKEEALLYLSYCSRHQIHSNWSPSLKHSRWTFTNFYMIGLSFSICQRAYKVFAM